MGLQRHNCSRSELLSMYTAVCVVVNVCPRFHSGEVSVVDDEAARALLLMNCRELLFFSVWVHTFETRIYRTITLSNYVANMFFNI